MRQNSIQMLIVRVLTAPLFAVFLFSVTEAKSLSDYKDAVWESVNQLRPFTDESVNFEDADMVKSAVTVLTDIRKKLPETEEIEFEKLTFKADNKWLSLETTAFSKQTDAAKKRVIILGIVERLEAIAVELSGLEYASERNASKDEEKRILADILKREEYKKAVEEEESPAVQLYNSIMEWLRKFFPQVKEPDPKNKADLSVVRNVLQVLIFVVALSLLAFLLIRFGPRLFRKYKSEKSDQGNRLILGEEIGPGATTANLFAEAEKLAAGGDIRGAIRKGYISLLFELSERKLIGLARHKTNRDYLTDLARKPVRTDVETLTGNYELHWYGGREAVDDDWRTFKQGYQKALNK